MSGCDWSGIFEAGNIILEATESADASVKCQGFLSEEIAVLLVVIQILCICSQLDKKILCLNISKPCASTNCMYSLVCHRQMDFELLRHCVLVK